MTCHHLLHHSHNSGWSHAPSSVAPAAGQKTAHTHTHHTNRSSTHRRQPIFKPRSHCSNKQQLNLTTSLKPNPHLIILHHRCCRDETPAARYTKTQKSSRKKKELLRTLGDRCQIPSPQVACTDLRNFKPQKAWPKKRIPKFLKLFG